jgi:hypothetical protein
MFGSILRLEFRARFRYGAGLLTFFQKRHFDERNEAWSSRCASAVQLQRNIITQRRKALAQPKNEQKAAAELQDPVSFETRKSPARRLEFSCPTATAAK